MRQRQRIAALAASAALVGVALTACSGAASDPFEYDPNAPLKYGVTSAAVDRGDWSTMVSWWTEDEPTTSFGFDLCIPPSTSVERITILGISAFESVGEVQTLQPLLVSGTDSSDRFISIAGYPPHLAASTHTSPIEGAEFTQSCDESTGFQRVVIGLRATTTSGGGWDGVVVRYEVSGSQRTLHVPVSYFMCGTSTEPCG